MKLKVTNLLVCLSFCCVLNATNGIPERYEMLETAKAYEGYSFNHIFFFDNENEFLFIDFEAISDELVALNIWRNEDLMMEDDVTDLPNNTIYEINTSIIRKGTYTIELVTDHEIKIRKEIEVK